MSSEGWERLQDLFHRATDLEGEERERFLERECGEDPDLKRQVLALLAGDVGDSRDLEETVRAAAGDLVSGALAPGDRVGPFRVVRELGRGGMGAVFLAERAEGDFDQQVALKVLGGMVASPGAVERFLIERRILAQLDHPGIARLLDGGTLPRGTPWFAMERVEGEPIDAWCDRRNLTVRRRLELFLAVCDAVQYAHRRLVVHRDLKPSNLLVGADGSPKLLDFGIAKLLEPEAGGSVTTRLGELPMTPEYASPEQVRGEPVTTATDVYQLGLLLYELLTGRRARSLTSRERREIERVVCEQEPTLPSAAVLSAAPLPGGRDARPAAEVASARALTAEGLRRRLKGDLDTIVLMALRREPERRYASVEQLAEDVRRHLDGRPVTAHRDSVLYRTRKLIARRAGPLAAAALVLAALVAGLLGTTLQARRARQEARRAEEVTEFLTNLISDADPDRSRGRDVTVREVLDRSARSLEVELESQPRLQATMQSLIGRIYSQLGQYEEAEAMLSSALERRRKILGPDHPDVADTSDRLARARLDLGRPEEAEILAREGLKIRRKALGEEDPAVAGSLVTLALVSFERGALDEGRSLLDEAFSILDKGTLESRPKLAEALHTAARIELQDGDPSRAERLVRRELEILRESTPSRTRALALALDALAAVLHVRGKPEQLQEAESALLESIEIEKSLLGEDHAVIANLLSNLAGVRARAGDFDGGEEAYMAALDSMGKALGPEHPEMGYVLNNLAVFYHRQGRWSEAIDYYNRCLDLRERVLGPEHPLVGTTRAYLGLALYMSGDPRAEETYRAALAELLETRGPENPQVGNLRTDLGVLLADQGRYAEAEPELRAALAILQPIFGDKDQRTDSARAGLGFALCGLGRPEEAGPLLESSREYRRERYPESHYRRAQIDLYEARCLASLGRSGEASRKIDKALSVLEGSQPESHPVVRLGRRLAEETRASR